MRRPWWFFLMLAMPLSRGFASEPVHGCFRTPAEAALGISTVAPSIAEDAVNEARSGSGFRLEAVRRDALLGRSWAVVRSCAHPERPAVVVRMLGEAGAVLPERVAAEARTSMPVLLAGARVQVTRTERSVRLSLVAVAERSAWIGDRVRLRVVREVGETEEFVEGIVRGAGLVEMDGGQ